MLKARRGTPPKGAVLTQRPPVAQAMRIRDLRPLLGFLNSPEGYLHRYRIPPADRPAFWTEHQVYRYALWQRVFTSAQQPRVPVLQGGAVDTDLLEGPEAEAALAAFLARAAWFWNQAPRFRQFERDQACARSPDELSAVLARYADLPTWDNITMALRILRRPKGRSIYPIIPAELSATSRGFLLQLREAFDALVQRTVHKCPGHGCGHYFIPGRRRPNQRYCDRCRRRGSRWTRWRVATGRTTRYFAPF